MPYEYDKCARQEAAEHQIDPAQVEQLAEQCRQKAAELGSDGVRGHNVCFSAAEWDEPPGLPDSVPRRGRISRGEVLDIGEQARVGALPATDLLITSFIWGWGTVGFGPHRLHAVLSDAGNRLEPSLQRVLAETLDDQGATDPVAGYALLYGGHDHKKRAAPGDESWARLRGYGPAFFTKFLYFSTLGALILDNRMANAVHRLSSLPYLVTKEGRSLPWTPYRYAVYLHWMQQTACTVGATPDLLELTLFQQPGNIDDEHDAAD